MSHQNAATKSQVWWSWPGGIGWPTPIPLKGGGMEGNILPPGFKENAQGVVAPPITVFNGGKRKNRKDTRKNRKNTRKANRKSRRCWSRRNNRK